MALTKSIDYKGWTTQAYASIEACSVVRVNKESFKVCPILITFKDSEKTVALSEDRSLELVIDYSSGGINFADVYTKIKENENWSDWDDVLEG